MLNPGIPRFWPIDTDTRRAWVFGLDVYGVDAPPIRQSKAFPSTIRLSRRSFGLEPRRGLPRPTAYSWTNTPLRTPRSFLFNAHKLGLAWWLHCFAINSVRKLRAALAAFAHTRRGFPSARARPWRVRSVEPSAPSLPEPSLAD